MNINCYYESLKDRPHDLEAIEGWKACWAKFGWEPVVHGADYSNRDNPFLAKAATWPTINPLEYELACWKRWVIASQIGGYWCDYDVLPYNFAPPIDDPSAGIVARTIDHNPACGLLYGQPEDFRRFLDFAYDLTPPYPEHHSDMIAWMCYLQAGRIEHEINDEGIWLPSDHYQIPSGNRGFMHVPWCAQDKWRKLRELKDQILAI